MSDRMRILRVVLITLFFTAASEEARAHGVESLGDHAAPPASTPGGGLWFGLISPAEAAARITIDEANGLRVIIADGIPDHATGQFPNRGNPNSISEQDYEFEVPLNPELAGRVTQLRRQPFGIALNGVLFDPGTAECWNNDCSSGWNIEVLGGGMDLGLDDNNAHVQPDGSYHYHGLPTGLLERLPYTRRPVLLGYAADGFPIYGPYGYRDAMDAGSGMMALRSGWRVKSGARPGGPGGQYDGTYTQDYDYAGGSLSLDECNGREGVTPEYPGGIYHYVLTDRFPHIPRCYRGTPDPSFERGPPGGGGPQAGGRPRGGGQQSGQPPRQDGQQGRPPPRQGGQQGDGQASGQQGGPPRGGPPDLNRAAATLGVPVEKLRRALGPPPPDLNRAARELGVSVDELRRALRP